MDYAERELLVARICSGSVRVPLRDKTYIIRKPTTDEMYAACEVYTDVLRESELQGLFSDDDLLEFLVENDLWDEEKEKLIEALPKEIEEFKVRLFKAIFKSNERKIIRKALATAKAKVLELSIEKAAFSHLSCAGAASIAKSRYILGCSLRTASNARVFNAEDLWEHNCSLLDDVVTAYSRLRLEEAAFRELARTEPWRSIWSGHTAESRLFGISPCDYTEEQSSIVNWTSLYDNVYKHEECPQDEVVFDDDLLDGWLIDQRRRREDRMGKMAGQELITNEKIRNSQEVFMVAETADDVKKVFDLNDDFGKATQKRRFEHLKKKGEVNEADMPDTAQRIRMEMTQRLSQSMKGTK